MSPIAIAFTLAAAIALLVVPRAWAPMPFLLGACYMTIGFKINLGPASMDSIRLLIAAGWLRVLMRHERPAGGFNGLDKIMLGWACAAVASSVFHKADSEGNPLIFRMGFAYNVLGIYFLMRCFLQSAEDVVRVAKVTGLVLVPVAAEMIQEKLTGKNLFSVLGGVRESVIIRDGHLRAQGPFRHPILAGTVGAVCFPFVAALYHRHRQLAIVGGAACMGMVLASHSSGPAMSFLFTLFALLLWRWRHLTRQMRIAAVVIYILLDIVMKSPGYYIIARIDITGSSTGWHRARLIESAFEHLNEWWLAGTDYTRHWMPTGVSWSPEHTDITNYYLKMGVLGGLPLMMLFILAVVTCFRYVGRSLDAMEDEPLADQFFVWSLGAALLAHAATCLSVSYFDQSYLFLFLTMAMISSLWQAQADGHDAEDDEPGDFVLAEEEEPADRRTPVFSR